MWIGGLTRVCVCVGGLFDLGFYVCVSSKFQPGWSEWHGNGKVSRDFADNFDCWIGLESVSSRSQLQFAKYWQIKLKNRSCWDCRSNTCHSEEFFFLFSFFLYIYNHIDSMSTWLGFKGVWSYARIWDNSSHQYDVHQIVKLHKHGGWSIGYNIWSIGCCVVVFVVVVVCFVPTRDDLLLLLDKWIVQLYLSVSYFQPCSITLELRVVELQYIVST